MEMRAWVCVCLEKMLKNEKEGRGKKILFHCLSFNFSFLDFEYYYYYYNLILNIKLSNTLTYRYAICYVSFGRDHLCILYIVLYIILHYIYIHILTWKQSFVSFFSVIVICTKCYFIQSTQIQGATRLHIQLMLEVNHFRQTRSGFILNLGVVLIVVYYYYY